MVKIYQNTIFTLLKTNQTRFATLIPMASFDILDLYIFTEAIDNTDDGTKGSMQYMVVVTDDVVSVL